MFGVCLNVTAAMTSSAVTSSIGVLKIKHSFKLYYNLNSKQNQVPEKVAVVFRAQIVINFLNLLLFGDFWAIAEAQVVHEKSIKFTRKERIIVGELTIVIWIDAVIVGIDAIVTGAANFVSVEIVII